MFGQEQICRQKNNNSASAVVLAEDFGILEASENHVDVHAAKAAAFTARPRQNKKYHYSSK